MTPAQRAEFAEWCRQRASDLGLLQYVDFDHPELENALEGIDLRTMIAASVAAAQAQNAAVMAAKDLEAVAKRLESV